MSSDYEMPTDEGGMNKGIIAVIALLVIVSCALGIWLTFFKEDEEDKEPSGKKPPSNINRSSATVNPESTSTSNTSSSGATASPSSTSNTSSSGATASPSSTSNTSSSGATASPSSTSNTRRRRWWGATASPTSTSNTRRRRWWGATASPTSTASEESEESKLNKQYNLWCQQTRGFKSNLLGTRWSWAEKLSSPFGLPQTINSGNKGKGSGRGLAGYVNNTNLSKKEFKVKCFKKCNENFPNSCGAVKLIGQQSKTGKPVKCVLIKKINTKETFDKYFNIAIEKDNKHTAGKRTSNPTSDNLYHGAEELYVKKEFLPNELRIDNKTNKEIVKDASFCPFDYISYNGWGGTNNYHSAGLHPASTPGGPNRMVGLGCKLVAGKYKSDNSIIRKCSEMCDSRDGCSGFWVWGKQGGNQTRRRRKNEGRCCLKGPLVPGRYEKLYVPGHNGKIPTNKNRRKDLDKLAPGGYFIKKDTKTGEQGAFPSKSHNCVNCLSKNA